MKDLDVPESGGSPYVLRIHAGAGTTGAVLTVGTRADGGRIVGETITLTGHQCREVVARLSDDTAERDQAMIERIEDDRRVFQALCTERGRLSALLNYDMGDSDAARERHRRLTATRVHTERLVRVWTDKIAQYPGTDAGCPCVVLPSGRVHPCDTHNGGAE